MDRGCVFRSTWTGGVSLGVCGQGKLTQDVIKKLQLYYGKAICSCTGDEVAMHSAVFSSFFHAVFLPFPSTTTTRQTRVESEYEVYTDCIKHYITKKTHLASDTRLRNAVVRAVKTGNYEVDGIAKVNV